MPNWYMVEEKEQRSFTLTDPALAEFLGVGNSYAGVPVTENTALSLSAVYRAVSLISGTMAAVSLKTFSRAPDGSKNRVQSFLDNPAGDGVTNYEFLETVLAHLLLHGNAFLLHVYGGGGQILALQIIHPSAVSIESKGLYKVSLASGGTRTYSGAELTHIPALSLDGIRGVAPLEVARNSWGTSIAGERSAARLFTNGPLISGIITPESGTELSAGDATAIAASVRNRVTGSENAGSIPVINRELKFQQWSINAADLQFLESRAFQVEEIARWFGVPSYLLMDQAKQTSFGSGVEVQGISLARHTLLPWAKRIEQRLSRLLGDDLWVEFDFSSLERPNVQDEIALLTAQVNGGILSLNEARKIRNLPPIDGGDELRIPSGVMLLSQLQASAEAMSVGEES